MCEWKKLAGIHDNLVSEIRNLRGIGGGEIAVPNYVRSIIPGKALQDGGGYLMPENASRLFSSWQTVFGASGVSPEAFMMFAATLYYGPAGHSADVPLIRARFNQVRKWVDEKKDHRFEAKDLPQLVLMYGLEINSKLRSIKGEHSDWQCRWSPAYYAISSLLDYHATATARQLRRLGFSGSFPDEIADEILGVLTGATKCECVRAFLEQHEEGGDEKTVQARCRREHCLLSWLNKTGWPTRGKQAKGVAGRATSAYDKKVYPLEQFLLRGVVGAPPTKAENFVKGLLSLRFKDDDGTAVIFQAVETLVCAEQVAASPRSRSAKNRNCNCPMTMKEWSERFKDCPVCGCDTKKYPKLKTNPLLIQADSKDWQSVMVTECVNCKKLFVDDAFCPHGICKKCPSPSLPSKQKAIKERLVYLPHSRNGSGDSHAVSYGSGYHGAGRRSGRRQDDDDVDDDD